MLHIAAKEFKMDSKSQTNNNTLIILSVVLMATIMTICSLVLCMAS